MLILSLKGLIINPFIWINPIMQKAVCNKCRLQTCSWQVNEVNIIVKCLDRFAIPSLNFKSFKSLLQGQGIWQSISQQCLPRLPASQTSVSQTSLARIFLFLKEGHEELYLSNFVLFRAMEIIYEKTKGRIPRDPHWENKTSTRLWWVGCSISRTLKTLSWSFLLRDFRKRKAIWEFQKDLTFKARLSGKHLLIGQLHDDVILLQLPESLSLLFSCAN